MSGLTELGRELRKLRIDKDLMLKDMALAMKTSPAYLSAVERGRKPPTKKLMDAVVGKFGFDLDVANRIYNDSFCPTCGRRKLTRDAPK